MTLFSVLIALLSDLPSRVSLLPEMPVQEPEEQKGKSAGGYFPLKEEKCDPGPSTVETLELCEDIKNSD